MFWLAIIATMAFAITAVLAIADRGVDIFGVVVLGVITAIGGGILRDVIAGRKNLLMSTELYAIPVALGCLLLMTSLHFYPHDAVEILLGCTAVPFLMRAAAIHWGLRVPAFLVTHSKSQ